MGNQRGTMKAFPITSDGTVNIDFTHVTENPLVNGIEIIDLDVPAGPAPGGRRSSSTAPSTAPRPVG